MGTVCWNPDPDKRLGIDNVLSTLEAAAEEWKPGSGSVALGPDPSGAQPQNMPPTLDETVNQILAEAGSPLGEGEARRLTEMLEKVCRVRLVTVVGASNSWTQKLGSCHDMDLETRRRCFHRLVEMCGEHSILPNSCIIQESKLQKQDEIPVSSGGSSVVWRGMYTENDGDKRRDVAIRVIRYSSRSNDEEIRKVGNVHLHIRAIVRLFAGFLPRGHHLEVSISSKYIGVSRRHDGGKTFGGVAMDGERECHPVPEEESTSESVETCTSYLRPVHFFADSNRSWQMLHAVFNIFTTWVSHTVTSKGYELSNPSRQHRSISCRGTSSSLTRKAPASQILNTRGTLETWIHLLHPTHLVSVVSVPFAGVLWRFWIRRALVLQKGRTCIQWG